jgi:ABC-type transport system involved in cytochrome bd biosynthesis fused ATPase/permease subunit
MEGRTTFVIAQRLDTVRDADQILVLEDGAIVERGTHAEPIRRDGFYRRLYDLQRRIRADERVAVQAAVRAFEEQAAEQELVAAGEDG